MPITVKAPCNSLRIERCLRCVWRMRIARGKALFTNPMQQEGRAFKTILQQQKCPQWRRCKWSTGVSPFKPAGLLAHGNLAS
mmetsp:Transcript_53574/g.116802  ORF Transcript_53574/g.116802 Transcript_53574/m.116802 type:complete len:82 (-) Transcript_53574:552-797(-)